MTEIVIRRAQAGDVSAISVLARECFTGSLAKYLITSQPGYGEFVADSLRAGDRQIFIGSSGTDLVSFAEVMPLSGDSRRVHLSRIAVSPAMQGQSLGTRMLTEIGARYFRDHDWRLDVFEENVRAVGWYQRLGFAEIGKQDWLAREIPLVQANVLVRMSNLERRRFETRGFGPLRVRDGEELALVGRAVRCKTLRQFGSDRLLASVKQAVPSVERAFVVVDHKEAVGPTVRHGARLLGTGLRMVGKLPA